MLAVARRAVARRAVARLAVARLTREIVLRALTVVCVVGRKSVVNHETVAL